MGIVANDHIEVAARGTVGSGVALPGNADTLPVASTRLDSNFEWFGAFDCALTVAGRTGGTVFARATAAWAGEIELHSPADLGDLTGAVAFRTFSRGLRVALPMATVANFAPRDVQPHDPAPDGCPKRNVDLVFEVGPSLRGFLGG